MAFITRRVPPVMEAGPSNVSDESTSGEEGTHQTIPVFTNWDISKHVLSTASLVGCSILRSHGRNRLGRGTCSCCAGEVHRDMFGLLWSVIRPSMKDDKPIPEIKVCWNAENLFECKLGRDLTGLNNRYSFSDLPNVGVAQSVLWKGTHWFPRLRGKSSEMSEVSIALLRLLAGKGSFTGPERVDQLVKLPLNKGAVSKLRNILATIDGLLMQLMICFPDKAEFHTWERVDQITHCLLCNLIPDYFRDAADITRLTTFEKVKQLRKAIKRVGFNPTGDLSQIEVPREISFFERILSFIGQQKRPVDLYRVATLCQTRGGGVPPPAVYLKTLLKIRTVLTEPVNPEEFLLVRPLIRPSIMRIHNQVLDRLGSATQIERFWSRCLDEAKISLSDSGEFFTSSESGGKLERARQILHSVETIPVRSLHTGEILKMATPSELGPGEALFYWALNEFSDRESVYERNVMSVRVSLVAELGKFRAITVSHLAHAVLLHVLSHVLLKYLSAVPSSESGVKAANHAWNFFKRLSHKNPSANFIFGDKDVYLFSTDWEQATDYCNQMTAQAILNNLCQVLGIPGYYRQTCVFALCAPRQIEEISQENKTLERYFTTRGELMGDPVTKVILHYYHLVARESAVMALDAIRATL
ncbi:putative RNA-dependent RNA polymerase [Cryphonectria naterciae splipalmivirus 1]|uniref:RNA-dependent RNA polymerase n=1 Tax=Cryphonectria naterciae splipalmivirus 1 TaxID=2841740 RepID=A0AAD1KLX6_9VIRU|nr:putative RNA-dependent RNA polymerase [Cryphonectria naterciae splipalmivirus 1]